MDNFHASVINENLLIHQQVYLASFKMEKFGLFLIAGETGD